MQNYGPKPSTIPEVEGFRLRLQAAYPEEDPIYTSSLEIFFQLLDEMIGSEAAISVMDEVFVSAASYVLADEDGESFDGKPSPYHRMIFSQIENRIVSHRVRETGESESTASREVFRRFGWQPR